MTKIKTKTLLTILAIITTCLLGCFCLTGCESKLQLQHRKATTNDLYIDLSQNISFSMTYTIIPSVDIEDLELTFKYKNSSNKVLSTKTKKLGDVSKDVEYKISVSLAEFSFFDLFKITQTNVSVSSGVVYY